MSEALTRRMATAPPPPPCGSRLCLLTGQSRLDASPLAPAQAAFLREVGGGGWTPLLRGFPFDGEEGATAPPPSLLLASWRNARQAWLCRTPSFQSLAVRVLQGLLDATERRLAIVTGSCGLEILAAAWPRLHLAGGPELRVLAFGPSGRPLALPGFRAAQGRRDLWSRALYRGRATDRLGCGHLGYWTDPAAKALAAAWLAS